MRKTIAGAALFLAIAGWAQLGDPTQRLDLEVRVTADGVPVAGLGPSDFQVKESGKVQTVAGAEYVTGGRDQPTWLYVAAQIPPQELSRVKRAIGQFVRKGLPAGIQVSLGGLPFTDDGAQLLKALESGAAPKEEPGGLPVLWQVNNEARLQEGIFALTRYMNLVQSLRGLRGRKAIVLFRSSLMIEGLHGSPPTLRQGLPGGRTVYSSDSDPTRNIEYLDRLATEALRSRVTFYVSDAAAEGTMAGAEQQGLKLLATRTGGSALIGAGDLSSILEAAARDSSGYYVVSYQPADTRYTGRFRKLSVDVRRQGVSVSHPDGYVEPKPFSQMSDEMKAAHLQRAFLLEENAASYPLRVSYEVFSGPEDDAAIVHTVGVHPSHLNAQKDGKGVAVDFTVAVQIMDAAGNRIAAADQRRSRQVFKEDSLEKAAQDPTSLLEVSSLVNLQPGEYECRIVLRDETTGRIGTHRSKLVVPDLTRPLAPSTLLLTRRAAKPDKPAKEDKIGRLFDAGKTRFVPESSRDFRVGDRIFLVYDLYNVPPDIMKEPPAPLMTFAKDQKPLGDVPADAQGFQLADRTSFRYALMVDTASFSPGTYQVFFDLPGKRRVEERFTLVPAL